MSKIKRFILNLLIVFLFLGLVGCQNKEIITVQNPENLIETKGSEDTEPEEVHVISDEDWETIEYINQNSHLDIEFMKPLEDVEIDTSQNVFSSYHEVGENSLAIGTGYYVSELNGMYLSFVEINSNDKESDIIGIKNGDKYPEAIRKLQGQGFNFAEEKSINGNYMITSFKKGKVEIMFYYRADEKIEKSDYTIENVSVRIDSYRGPSENEVEAWG